MARTIIQQQQGRAFCRSLAQEPLLQSHLRETSVDLDKELKTGNVCSQLVLRTFGSCTTQVLFAPYSIEKQVVSSTSTALIDKQNEVSSCYIEFKRRLKYEEQEVDLF